MIGSAVPATGQIPSAQPLPIAMPCTPPSARASTVLAFFLIGLYPGFAPGPWWRPAESGAQEVDAEQIIATGKLNRFDPLSPAEAYEAFEVQPGYRVELVAAEPLVIDPVAYCFDARGRMIVVEMRGYSERADSYSGRVRRLTDVDGDGTMDEAETLIDGLSWPTAVACWGDGILIGVAPHVMYVPPPEQGGAEKAEVWFDGFGKSNVQGLFNSFQWGPDLRLHGATSSSGGEVTGPGLAEPLRIGRRDFAIAWDDRRLEPVDGGGQHGMSFGHWGDKFVCSNSDHLQQVWWLPPRAGRADRYSDVPPLRRSIAADGPQADVYRSSPDEPWRILRTHLRVTGQVSGPVEGGGRAAGYFTGATGVHAYVGDQWPETEDPLALVCDVGGNLVHRKRLEPDGLWYRGVRIDDRSEFLRSTDTWFRPVQLGDGPDGALYVVDMYREVIEHPKSLPPEIKSQVDLNSGNDRGRIWRIVAEDRPIRRSVGKPLDERTSAELVETLEHPNAWQRRTAARLLVARTIDPPTLQSLRETARQAALAESRIEALAVLHRIPEGIDAETLHAALGDVHPRVRQQGVGMAADGQGRASDLPAGLLASLAGDPSPHVRFRLAHDAIRLVPDPERRAEILASIALASGTDRWIRWAVEGSLGEAAEPFLRRLTADADQAIMKSWLNAVATQVLQQQSAAAVGRLVGSLRDDGLPAEARRGLLGAVAGQVAGMPRGDAALSPLVAWAEADIASDLVTRAAAGRIDPDRDDAALRIVAWASPARAAALFHILADPQQSPQRQRLALRTLVTNDRERIASVFERLSAMTPSVREEAWEAVARTRLGLQAVAAEIRDGRLVAASLPETLLERMRQSKDQGVAESVADVQRESGVSPETLRRYQAALDAESAPDPAAGRETFRRVCAVCHEPPEGKRPVGPPLKSVVEKSPEQILLAILDPNREVDPKYFLVQVVTDSGQILSGILVDESDTSLVIVDSQGQERQVARAAVESLQTSDRSLMPENLAAEIDEGQMRDLIAYLRRPAEPESATDAALDNDATPGTDAVSGTVGIPGADAGSTDTEWAQSDASFWYEPSFWRSLDGEPADKHWQFETGEVRLLNPRGGRGSLISPPVPRHFELTFRWMIGPGANNGLKYRVRQYGNQWLGIEYQMIEEPIPLPEPSKGSTASIYDLVAPTLDKPLRPSGEWNDAKIVAHGDRIEHYLNGVRVAQAVTRGPDWQAAIARSKFYGREGFGDSREGDRLMLTDHGGEAAYRDFRLTVLDPPPASDEGPRPPQLSDTIRVEKADHRSAKITVRTLATSQAAGQKADEPLEHEPQVPSRHGAPGEIRLTYFPDRQAKRAVSTDWVATSIDDDDSHAWALDDLRPETTYVVIVEARPVGASDLTAVRRTDFETAPAPDDTASAPEETASAPEETDP